MKGILRPLILAIAASLAGPVHALDLPIKDINGKQYYYYAVKRGDTLMAVAARLGVTREDITAYNPSAADGLRQGTTLYLPVEKYKNVISPAAQAPARQAATFTYTVKKGETLFGISHHFGVTPDDIIALNPGANAGVREGQKLIIPGGEISDADAAAQMQQAAEEMHEIAAAEPGPALLPTENDANDVPPAPELPITNDGERRLTPVNPPLVEINENTPEAADTASIAVILPLMLSQQHLDKHAKSATDFVRGFMLGLREYSHRGVPTSIEFYDSKGSATAISELLKQPDVQNADIIIAPEDATSLAAIVEGSAGSDAYILNLLSVQDTTYLHNDRIMQANVPHDIMYEKAAEGLVTIYEGYTPVFLISKGGRSEKLAFTDYLRSQFTANEIPFREITFEGMLSAADLEELPMHGNYVFIPASGSLTEFNKFARPLLTFRDTFADPSAVGVFGYPDWTTFRSDALEMLHRLGATIYSRFYADSNSGEVRKFTEDFTAEYGVAPIDQVPSQAMLGYDAACYLMDNLMNHQGVLDTDHTTAFHGIQSSFKFNAVENIGPVNQVVYIVTFLPGENVKISIL